MFVTHYGKKLISLPLLNIMEEALFEKGENAVFLLNFSETCVQWLLIISFCHELLCVDFLQIFEIFASKEMFLKKWAPSSSIHPWFDEFYSIRFVDWGQMDKCDWWWDMTWPTKGKDKYKETLPEAQQPRNWLHDLD